MSLFRREKSLGEIEEDIEHKQAENELMGMKLSLAQKKMAIAELKKRGLTPKLFLFDWGKIIQWLKTH